MRYKTLEERQNLNNTNNLYYKYEVDVNDNNFNQIMFGNLEDKSCKSIKNYRINNNKIFRSVTDNCFFQSFNKNKNMNYINLKSYNKSRDNSSFIIKNNVNNNQIKSYLIIDNNKRNINTLNIYINRGNFLKRQKNNNMYEINSNRNIHQYY